MQTRLQKWLDKMEDRKSVEPVLYLSGPMSGYPDFNAAAFFRATDMLREKGYTVINPHELPEPDVTNMSELEAWAEYLARDVMLFAKITSPVVLVLLPGWELSRGSLLERAVAKHRGFRIVTYGDILKEGFHV